ncbi:hypothetical protein D8M21_10975 [Kocuria sp. HSID16901]|nr:hypothetical protein D8M21_10975 [Kocuria sp. HSID16901]
MNLWIKILAVTGVTVLSAVCLTGALACGTWFLGHLSELGNARSVMNYLSLPVIAVLLGMVGYYGVLALAVIVRIPSKVAK